jgi:hypothetical protein
VENPVERVENHHFSPQRRFFAPQSTTYAPIIKGRRQKCKRRFCGFWSQTAPNPLKTGKRPPFAAACKPLLYIHIKKDEPGRSPTRRLWKRRQNPPDMVDFGHFSLLDPSREAAFSPAFGPSFSEKKKPAKKKL